MRVRLLFAALAVLISSLPAGATVITFEDLPEDVTALPGTYGGINWLETDGQAWFSYGWEQDPYNAHSGTRRAFNNATGSERAFEFVGGNQVFYGGWFAGHEGEFVALRLYNDGELVHSSAQFTLSDIPTFFDAGYGGLVDRVCIVASEWFVLDDVSYLGQPVMEVLGETCEPIPEPTPSELLAVALVVGLLSCARRGRRRSMTGL